MYVEFMIMLIKLNLVIINLLAYEDGTECSKMSAYKIQTPGTYPEENILHTEHGKSLKSRKLKKLLNIYVDNFSSCSYSCTSITMI
jgi:hypothetical protein